MAKKYCNQCGAYVMASFVKCPQCGSQSWSTVAPQPHTPKPSGGHHPTPSGHLPVAKKGFIAAVSHAASKTFSPTGRASRSEYWFLTLFNVLVIAALFGAMTFVGLRYDWSSVSTFLLVIIGIFYTWAFICVLMISIRRLHDMNLSGWWTLAIYFVPALLGSLQNIYVDAVGFFVTLQIMISVGVMILFSQRGTSGPNRFGDEPPYFL